MKRKALTGPPRLPGSRVLVGFPPREGRSPRSGGIKDFPLGAAAALVSLPARGGGRFHASIIVHATGRLTAAGVIQTGASRLSLSASRQLRDDALRLPCSFSSCVRFFVFRCEMRLPELLANRRYGGLLREMFQRDMIPEKGAFLFPQNLRRFGILRSGSLHTFPLFSINLCIFITSSLMRLCGC